MILDFVRPKIVIGILASAPFAFSASEPQAQVLQGLPDLVEASQEVSREKGKIEARISTARSAFFNEKATPAQKEKARDELYAALRQKDMSYAILLITGGVTDASWNRIRGMYALSGGELDGGIAPEALPLFNGWIDTVRSGLGARSPGQLLIVNDRAQLERAMVAATPAYEKYIAVRNAVELQKPALAKQNADMARKASAALSPDGSPAYHDSKIRTLVIGDWPYEPSNEEFDRLLRSAVANNQKVIDCNYGPVVMHGELNYRTFSFWSGPPPPQIDRIRALDRSKYISKFGREATATCPPSALKAQELKQDMVARLPAVEQGATSATPAPRPTTREGPNTVRNQERAGPPRPNISLGHRRNLR